jgi:ATP-dependent Clp protease adapter protein ClpS
MKMSNTVGDGLVRINLYPQFMEDTETDIEWESQEDIAHEDGPWVVILYNCDCHSFEEVTQQLRLATGCGVGESWKIALQAHLTGRAIAYTGGETECRKVERCLRSIRLQVEMDIF